MNQNLLLAALALSGAGTILMQDLRDPLRYIAAVFAAVNLLMAMNLLKLAIAGVPTALVIGGVLVVAGVVLYVRTQGKLLTAASTVLAMTGALKVVATLA